MERLYPVKKCGDLMVVRSQFSAKKFKEIIEWTNVNKDRPYTQWTKEWISGCLHDMTVLRGCYIQTKVCGETLRKWLQDATKQEEFACLERDKFRVCEDMSALDFLHRGDPKNFILHRDLRPENIYFTSHRFQLPVKVGDFGLSNAMKTYADMTQTRQVGNSFYRAPEMSNPYCDSQGQMKAKYGPAVDLFSAGLIISEVFHPVTVEHLEWKLNRIRYDKDTGELIREKFPKVDRTILQLTSRDSSERHPLGPTYLQCLWQHSVIADPGMELD